MSRVITFSRHFPAYHSKAGHPTFFIEQIYNSIKIMIGITKANGDIPEPVWPLVNDFVLLDGTAKKHHTIRAGKRWKVGDKFSPRVWGTDINLKSGKSGPYQSKQITIAPDIEIVKVWDITVELIRTPAGKYETARYGFKVNGHKVSTETLAANDGLEYDELRDWFQLGELLDKPRLKHKVFDGQIICWNKDVEYLPTVVPSVEEIHASMNC